MPLKPIAANTGASKKIYLLKPRGFCAGVVRAIDVVKIALNLYGPPVYVRKEIVHNKHVVDELREMGAVFVEELEEVPAGGRAIFSAHGVSPEVRRQGKDRSLAIIDATCPLVTKVHLEAVKFAREGYTIILIGHKNHDEVIGTLGEAPAKMTLVESVEDVDALNIPDPARVAYLTQTTLSLDETRDIVARLEQRFPMIRGPKSQDICYATENRQMAVKGVSDFCQMILVVGSDNSSNSKRLVEVGKNYGVEAHLVNDWSNVNPAWLEGITNIGVTAGASAPEHLVEEIVSALRAIGFEQLEEVEMVEEDVRFSLPPELASAASTQIYSISR
jgi:4-hydroxy-3-methylbut-2-enyl diphosphate reductase